MHASWTQQLQQMGAVPACRFLQGKDTDKEAVDNIRQAIKSGSETTVRILNYKKSGKPFWNMFTLAPMADVDGTPRFLIGVQVCKCSCAVHVCSMAGLCSYAGWLGHQTAPQMGVELASAALT